jgi:hypothetical protein
VTEFYRAGLTTVLTADTHNKLGVGAPAQLHSHFHQFAYPITVEDRKGVISQNFLFNVLGYKLPFSIITTEAKGRLCQVIGSKGEGCYTREVPFLSMTPLQIQSLIPKRLPQE